MGIVCIRRLSLSVGGLQMNNGEALHKVDHIDSASRAINFSPAGMRSACTALSHPEWLFGRTFARSSTSPTLGSRQRLLPRCRPVSVEVVTPSGTLRED